MKRKSEGYMIPASKHVIADTIHDKFPAYDILFLGDEFTLIDSSDMNFLYLNRLIKVLRENGGRYDSIFIFHGTDTVSYTASVLSFFLEDLKIPIILLCSHRSIFEEEASVIRDLEFLFLKIHYPQNLPDVYVYYEKTLYKGNQISKFSTDNPLFYSKHAYRLDHPADWETRTPKYEPAGRTGKNDLFLNLKDAVLCLRVTPNFDFTSLTAIGQYFTIIILECLGDGNIPVGNNAAAIIKSLIDRGCIVIVRTQCPFGITDLSKYQGGWELLTAGVIPSPSITIETCYAKSLYLLERKRHNGIDVKEAFKMNLRGEIDNERNES